MLSSIIEGCLEGSVVFWRVFVLDGLRLEIACWLLIKKHPRHIIKHLQLS